MKKLGQMFITGIQSLTLSDSEIKFLKDENIGGVILFKNNFETPAQLAELINHIQSLRDEYPLFVAVDHEGGRVLRFKDYFTQIPSMMDIGRTKSPKICFQMHQIMAEELKSCGINLNLAPCCDVLTNKSNKVIGDRSFSSDPKTVSTFVSSAVRGLQTSSIISCAKHFPGHGSTIKDSHFDLPIVKTVYNDLEKIHFLPFVKAIKARVEFVMMAHLIVDEIDPDLPASLSLKAHQVLRKNLKFNKIILSDDMNMKAISDRFAVDEAAKMAIKAGSDILEYRNMDDAIVALDAIKKMYRDKDIAKADVDEKISRIFSCKREYLKNYAPTFIPDIGKKLNTKSSKKFFGELKRKYHIKTV